MKGDDNLRVCEKRIEKNRFGENMCGCIGCCDVGDMPCECVCCTRKCDKPFLNPKFNKKAAKKKPAKSGSRRKK